MRRFYSSDLIATRIIFKNLQIEVSLILLPVCYTCIIGDQRTIAWEPPTAKMSVFGVIPCGCMIASMPRRMHNWSYKDVTNFLREHAFSFYKQLRGSHQTWIKRGTNGEKDTIVELNFTHRSYPQGTLKLIIRQSGIDKSEWFEWGGW